MAKTIEPKLTKIGNYLKLDNDVLDNDIAFIIPAYQRAYSWDTDRCDKLWADLVEYTNNDSKDAYFFGTVILNCQNNDSDFLLIDGQQRTTTFFLLLKAFLIHINNAIRHTENDEDFKDAYRALRDRRKNIMNILYRIDPDDIPDEIDDAADLHIFERCQPLIKNNSIRERHATDFEAILKSINFEQAENNVAKIDSKRKDNKYSNFFRNFKFFYGKIAELSESELNKISKTFLEKSEIIEIRSWNLDQAITMFNSLNSDSLPLNDADIISSKLYESAEKQSLQTDFVNLWDDFHSHTESLDHLDITTIDQILMQYMYYERTLEALRNHKAVDTTTPGLRRYFLDVNKDAINNPLNFAGDVIRLAKLWTKAYEYPCVQVLLRFNENAKLFLASYLLRFEDTPSEAELQPIVEGLLKLFTLLEVEEVGYSSKNFKTFLFNEEVRLADPAVPASELAADFRQHIVSNWQQADIKAKITAYDKNMLVYLNEYLYAAEHNLPFDLKSKWDIEHIMPASGRNIQVIRTDAGISDEVEFHNIVNKLGNKIILEYSINRSIGSEWFRTKISTSLKDKTGYINSKYPLAQALVNKYQHDSVKFWTKDDISAATEQATQRITKFIFN